MIHARAHYRSRRGDHCVGRRAASAIASSPGFERRPGVSWDRAAGSKSVREGRPDLAFSQCVQSEQAMRQKLVNEWSTFLPTEKSNCIGAEMGGMASYTDLVSCLEMARDARQLNQGK
jgi:hypothetical protein